MKLSVVLSFVLALVSAISCLRADEISAAAALQECLYWDNMSGGVSVVQEELADLLARKQWCEENQWVIVWPSEFESYRAFKGAADIYISGTTLHSDIYPPPYNQDYCTETAEIYYFWRLLGQEYEWQGMVAYGQENWTVAEDALINAMLCFIEAESRWTTYWNLHQFAAVKLTSAKWHIDNAW